VDGKWLLRTATTVAVAVALTGPSPATAAVPCPPEQTVAALDQYCEALPGVGGMVAPTASGPGRAAMRPLRVVLPPKEVESLRNAGPAAMALLQLPVVAPVTQEDRRRADLGAREVVASGALDSPKGDVPGVASGLASAAPDVVSGAFRWALVLSSLGLAAMAWLRFRSRLML
jgi:hypothetical protein